MVNGNLAASTATSTTVGTNTNSLIIGSSYGSSGVGIGEECFNGIIDDVRVYNRALSAAEIAALYNAQK